MKSAAPADHFLPASADDYVFAKARTRPRLHDPDLQAAYDAAAASGAVMLQTAAPTQALQGIVVPGASVNPQAFFANTRRLTFTEKTFSFAGLGQTDTISILQTGIVSGISIKVTGSVVVTLGGGTAATSARWPYDLIQAVRFSANGQSNLINCSGWKLKVRDIMARGDLTDRGVSQGIGGASPGTARTQGTLSLNNDLWGLGSNVSAIPGAPTTYNFEFDVYLPVAMDEQALVGAIFAQTSSTDLVVAIDWAPSAALFTLTGAATAVVSATVQITGRVFTIPQDGQGGIWVPDLSTFHSLIQSTYRTVAVGDNEIRLVGQGVGRQLMRVFWQLWNGAVGTAAPLAMNETNFGQVLWRYGGNDTPEMLPDGRHLAYFNERLYDCDIASLQGFGSWDFASEWAFRDSIDEGTATELRILVNITNSAPALVAPALEYVQETLFAGATGA